jgi:hypothetical protein
MTMKVRRRCACWQNRFGILYYSNSNFSTTMWVLWMDKNIQDIETWYNGRRWKKMGANCVHMVHEKPNNHLWELAPLEHYPMYLSKPFTFLNVLLLKHSNKEFQSSQIMYQSLQWPPYNLPIDKYKLALMCKNPSAVPYAAAMWT